MVDVRQYERSLVAPGRRATNGRRLLLQLLFWGGLAGLVSLSAWQWQRANEKAGLLAQQAARRTQPVSGWAEAARLSDDIAGRPVTLTGHFLPGYRVALDNQIRQGRAGMHLYMAFQPEGASQAVLVNLGWVSSDRQGGPVLPEPRPVARRIHGHARLPSAFYTVGEPEQARAWLRVGRIVPSALSARWHQPLAAWTLDLAPDVPGGFQRDALPPPASVISPDRHRGYAVQWLALAAAWIGCWLAVSRREAHS